MDVLHKGIEFDPGFAPYILAFQPSVEYIYADINKFKNLSQKKIKFQQYYKKLFELLENNIGFYIGCLMWAAYIKTQPVQDILHNNCLGQNWTDEENTYEVDFIIRFVTLFPKDMKYFLGKDFEFPEDYLKILNLYREFLLINKGFSVATKTSDILLPDNLKAYQAELFAEKIEKVLEQKDLSKLLEYKDLL